LEAIIPVSDPDEKPEKIRSATNKRSKYIRDSTAYVYLSIIRMLRKYVIIINKNVIKRNLSAYFALSLEYFIAM
tara:strand:+ start:376 stop:597 length:222 start_codon:yes stop_codon:yes gene_type:complete